MFAVIRTGGKQHRVRESDRIVVERLPGATGEMIAIDDVLMLAGDGAAPQVGDAVPAEARVFAEVVTQRRGPKVLIFKKKRRKNHRRLKGHRQEQTVLHIRAISPTGVPPAATATATPTAAATASEPADAAAAAGTPAADA
jgi:large subunit ribosomal protein L21